VFLCGIHRSSFADMKTTKVPEAQQGDGWEIATVYDTRDFFVDVIVPSIGSRFKTPYEAAQHVLTKAKTNDAACIAALRHVAASNAARHTKTTGKKK
jgi:hypothetical protein